MTLMHADTGKYLIFILIVLQQPLTPLMMPFYLIGCRTGLAFTALNWFHSYSTNRYFNGCINNHVLLSSLAVWSPSGVAPWTNPLLLYMLPQGQLSLSRHVISALYR